MKSVHFSVTMACSLESLQSEEGPSVFFMNGIVDLSVARLCPTLPPCVGSKAIEMAMRM